MRTLQKITLIPFAKLRGLLPFTHKGHLLWRREGPAAIGKLHLDRNARGAAPGPVPELPTLKQQHLP